LLDPSETEIVVPPEDAAAPSVFAPEHEAFIRNAIRRHLRCHFGYDYR